MSEPVNRFCGLLASLPKEQAEEVIGMACILLGQPMRRKGVPWDDTKPLGEVFHPHTTDDLNARLLYLTKEEHVRVEFLINGLFSYLIDHYEGSADSTPEIIDSHLAMREHLQAELRKPVHEREDQLSDEMAERLLTSVERILSGKPAQRIASEEIAAQLKLFWAEEFSRDYWRKWSFRN